MSFLVIYFYRNNLKIATANFIRFISIDWICRARTIFGRVQNTSLCKTHSCKISTNRYVYFQVICSECSDNKAMLQYDMSKPMKVCTRCFNILNGRRRSETTEKEKKSSVLEVRTQSLINLYFGYVFKCSFFWE